MPFFLFSFLMVLGFELMLARQALYHLSHSASPKHVFLMYLNEEHNISDLWDGVDGGNVNNVQHKSNWNCQYESPLYNEYILIKNL
jgi:hypothetical protein